MSNHTDKKETFSFGSYFAENPGKVGLVFFFVLMASLSLWMNYASRPLTISELRSQDPCVQEQLRKALNESSRPMTSMTVSEARSACERMAVLEAQRAGLEAAAAVEE